MRIRLLISSLILALGIISAQMPVRHSVADISGCNFGPCMQVPSSFGSTN
jgi:hypothetical protein